MELEIATKVSKALVKIYKDLYSTMRVMEAGCDQAEFEKYRRSIADAMATISFQLMDPIFKQYPDLEPPEAKHDSPNTQTGESAHDS